MENFLKAKHWQLFILFFGIPFLAPFFMIGSFIEDIVSMQGSDPSVLLKNFIYFPIIMLIYIVVMYGWYWSVGIGLQNKVPKNIVLKVERFKVLFFFPLVYSLASIFLVFWLFSSFENWSASEPNPEDFIRFFAFFALLIPVHLFAVFCTFYIFFFCAKTIKTVQLQREVVFGDFIGEFFLIWFFPIGVWILQPEINKLVK